MVRSLATWTKTLSFPARISPNNNKHKDIIVDVNSPTVTPTLSNNSLTKNNIINNNNNTTEYVNNIMNSSPISDVSKVSFFIINFLFCEN